MIATTLKYLVLLMFIPVLATVAITDVAFAKLHADDPVDDTAVRDTLAPALAGLPDRITAAIDEDRLVSVSMAIVLDRDIIFCQAFGHADLMQQRLASDQ
jgi:hypothetical protein